ncbi:hypothetical protein HDU98_005322 [Podochytrium sp. JEL0797]|nr:hypothetical protein HDU98_005322 [Podochytrium sp. JEL0797]
MFPFTGGANKDKGKGRATATLQNDYMDVDRENEIENANASALALGIHFSRNPDSQEPGFPYGSSSGSGSVSASAASNSVIPPQKKRKVATVILDQFTKPNQKANVINNFKKPNPKANASNNYIVSEPKESTRSYSCTFDGCGKVLTSASGMKSHMKSHPEFNGPPTVTVVAASGETIKFCCSACDQCLATAANRWTHFQKMHGDDGVEPLFTFTEAAKKETKTFPCPHSTCPEKFTSANQLKKHRQNRHKEFFGPAIKPPAVPKKPLLILESVHNWIHAADKDEFKPSVRDFYHFYFSATALTDSRALAAEGKAATLNVTAKLSHEQCVMRMNDRYREIVKKQPYQAEIYVILARLVDEFGDSVEFVLTLVHALCDINGFRGPKAQHGLFCDSVARPSASIVEESKVPVFDFTRDKIEVILETLRGLVAERMQRFTNTGEVEPKIECLVLLGMEHIQECLGPTSAAAADASGPRQKICQINGDKFMGSCVVGFFDATKPDEVFTVVTWSDASIPTASCIKLVNDVAQCLCGMQPPPEDVTLAIGEIKQMCGLDFSAPFLGHLTPQLREINDCLFSYNLYTLLCAGCKLEGVAAIGRDAQDFWGVGGQFSAKEDQGWFGRMQEFQVHVSSYLHNATLSYTPDLKDSLAGKQGFTPSMKRVVARILLDEIASNPVLFKLFSEHDRPSAMRRVFSHMKEDIVGNSVGSAKWARCLGLFSDFDDLQMHRASDKMVVGCMWGGMGWNEPVKFDKKEMQDMIKSRAADGIRLGFGFEKVSDKKPERRHPKVEEENGSDEIGLFVGGSLVPYDEFCKIHAAARMLVESGVVLHQGLIKGLQRLDKTLQSFPNLKFLHCLTRTLARIPNCFAVPCAIVFQGRTQSGVSTLSTMLDSLEAKTKSIPQEAKLEAVKLKLGVSNLEDWQAVLVIHEDPATRVRQLIKSYFVVPRSRNQGSMTTTQFDAASVERMVGAGVLFEGGGVMISYLVAGVKYVGVVKLGEKQMGKLREAADKYRTTLGPISAFDLKSKDPPKHSKGAEVSVAMDGGWEDVGAGGWKTVAPDAGAKVRTNWLESEVSFESSSPVIHIGKSVHTSFHDLTDLIGKLVHSDVIKSPYFQPNCSTTTLALNCFLSLYSPYKRMDTKTVDVAPVRRTKAEMEELCVAVRSFKSFQRSGALPQSLASVKNPSVTFMVDLNHASKADAALTRVHGTEVAAYIRVPDTISDFFTLKTNRDTPDDNCKQTTYRRATLVAASPKTQPETSPKTPPETNKVRFHPKDRHSLSIGKIVLGAAQLMFKALKVIQPPHLRLLPVKKNAKEKEKEKAKENSNSFSLLADDDVMPTDQAHSTDRSNENRCSLLVDDNAMSTDLADSTDKPTKKLGTPIPKAPHAPPSVPLAEPADTSAERSTTLEDMHTHYVMPGNHEANTVLGISGGLIFTVSANNFTLLNSEAHVDKKKNKKKKANMMDVDVNEAEAHVEAIDAVDAALANAPVMPVNAGSESNPVCTKIVKLEETYGASLAIAGSVTDLREFNDRIVRKVLLMGDAANGETISVNCSTGVVEVEQVGAAAPVEHEFVRVLKDFVGKRGVLASLKPLDKLAFETLASASVDANELLGILRISVRDSRLLAFVQFVYSLEDIDHADSSTLSLVSMIALLTSTSNTLIKSISVSNNSPSVHEATIRDLLASGVPFLVVPSHNGVSVVFKYLCGDMKPVELACRLIREAVSQMQIICGLTVAEVAAVESVLRASSGPALDPLSLRGSQLKEFAKALDLKLLGGESAERMTTRVFRFFDKEMLRLQGEGINVETHREAAVKEAVDLLVSKTHEPLFQATLDVTVHVTEPGEFDPLLSFHVKYSNMSEVMAKSTSMLLTREPLDEIAKLNFVSKPPQYECRYPTCCKDSAGKEKKPPSFTTLSNCKQHIMRHREREEPGSVRPNPEYVKLDPPAPNTPPAVGGDAMDVDGVEVGGGASAGGPVAKDAKPLQTTLNVLVSKSGSDAMFGILNTAASFDVKPSDIPDKVAQFASRTNHHWNLSVLNRSNNNKSEAPAISAEEVKLNRPYRMSALEADKIFDFARFGEWTLNHLLSAKHGFTNLLADGENKRETDLFSAIHRNNIKSDFGNFKDKLLKAKDNKPVIEKLRSFHRSNYINGRRIFGLPPQQFHLTPVNNISVEFKGHDGFHELKSTKARDVCYTDSWAGGKKLRSKIEAQKVRVTLAVPLSKPRITIEMNVDGHQQPKNLETVVDQYLNLVRGENQDFDFASAQVMFCPETNQLRFHVPMKPNDSKRALPNPVEVKPLAKHTCSGNCLDCIKIRTDFKERTVKEGSFEPFRFEKHGEFVHPGLKGFNGMGMLRVKLSGNQWNASDKSAVGADIGHHTPYLMCDTALNFFEFGREGAQQLPYLLQCRSACQSLLDKGINTTAAVVEATRKAAEARLKRDNGKALPAEDRAKLETAVVKAAEDLAKERKTAKERIDKDAEDEQRKNQVAYDELRKAKFAQHYRARVGHNGREPPTHVHIGPFVPRSLSARIALYDKKIDAFAARLKDVVVRFTSVFDVVAFPDYKTNTAFKRLGFASIRDAVKREKDKRGGLFVLINEAFTTCLCPLCGSDSNPGRSRYFICTDPACGFRCDRDSKSALLILLMLLLVPKTKTNMFPFTGGANKDKGKGRATATLQNDYMDVDRENEIENANASALALGIHFSRNPDSQEPGFPYGSSSGSGSVSASAASNSVIPPQKKRKVATVILDQFTKPNQKANVINNFKKPNPKANASNNVCQAPSTPHLKMYQYIVSEPKESTRSYSCTFDGCGKVLTSASGMKSHMKSHPEFNGPPTVTVVAASGETIKFCCSACDQCLATAANRWTHFQKMHGDDGVEPLFTFTEAAKKETKTFPCPHSTCPEKFTSANQLKKHRQNRHKEFFGPAIKPPAVPKKPLLILESVHNWIHAADKDEFKPSVRDFYHFYFSATALTDSRALAAEGKAATLNVTAKLSHEQCVMRMNDRYREIVKKQPYQAEIYVILARLVDEFGDSVEFVLTLVHALCDINGFRGPKAQHGLFCDSVARPSASIVEESKVPVFDFTRDKIEVILETLRGLVAERMQRFTNTGEVEPKIECLVLLGMEHIQECLGPTSAAAADASGPRQKICQINGDKFMGSCVVGFFDATKPDEVFTVVTWSDASIPTASCIKLVNDVAQCLCGMQPPPEDVTLAIGEIKQMCGLDFSAPFLGHLTPQLREINDCLFSYNLYTLLCAGCKLEGVAAIGRDAQDFWGVGGQFSAKEDQGWFGRMQEFQVHVSSYLHNATLSYTPDLKDSLAGKQGFTPSMKRVVARILLDEIASNPVLFKLFSEHDRPSAMRRVFSHMKEDIVGNSVGSAKWARCLGLFSDFDDLQMHRASDKMVVGCMWGGMGWNEPVKFDKKEMQDMIKSRAADGIRLGFGFEKVSDKKPERRHPKVEEENGSDEIGLFVGGSLVPYDEFCKIHAAARMLVESGVVLHQGLIKGLQRLDKTLQSFPNLKFLHCLTRTLARIPNCFAVPCAIVFQGRTQSGVSTLSTMLDSLEAKTKSIPQEAKLEAVKLKLGVSNLEDWQAVLVIHEDPATRVRQLIKSYFVVPRSRNQGSMTTTQFDAASVERMVGAGVLFEGGGVMISYLVAGVKYVGVVKLGEKQMGKLREAADKYRTTLGPISAFDLKSKDPPKHSKGAEVSVAMDGGWEDVGAGGWKTVAPDAGAKVRTNWLESEVSFESSSPVIHIGKSVHTSFHDLTDLIGKLVHSDVIKSPYFQPNCSTTTLALNCFLSLYSPYKRMDTKTVDVAPVRRTKAEMEELCVAVRSFKSFQRSGALPQSLASVKNPSVTFMVDLNHASKADAALTRVHGTEVAAYIRVPDTISDFFTLKTNRDTPDDNCKQTTYRRATLVAASPKTQPETSPKTPPETNKVRFHPKDRHSLSIGKIVLGAAQLMFKALKVIQPPHLRLLPVKKNAKEKEKEKAKENSNSFSLLADDDVMPTDQAHSTDRSNENRCSLLVDDNAMSTDLADSTDKPTKKLGTPIPKAPHAPPSVPLAEPADTSAERSTTLEDMHTHYVMPGNHEANTVLGISGGLIFTVSANNFTLLNSEAHVDKKKNKKKKANMMDVDVNEAEAHVEAIDAVDAALANAPVMPVNAGSESNPVCTKIVKLEETYGASLAIAGSVTDLREFNDRIVRKVLLMGDAANGETISVNCSTGVVEVEQVGAAAPVEHEFVRVLKDFVGKRGVLASLKPLDKLAFETLASASVDANELLGILRISVRDSRLLAFVQFVYSLEDIDHADSSTLSLVSMIALLTSTSNTLIKSISVSNNSPSVHEATIRDLLASGVPFLVVPSHNGVSVVFKYLCGDMKPVELACRLIREAVSQMQIICGLTVAEVAAVESVLRASSGPALDPLSLRGSQLKEFAKALDLKLLGGESAERMTTRVFRFFDKEMLRLQGEGINVETHREAAVKEAVDLLVSKTHEPLFQATLDVTVHVTEPGEFDPLLSFHVKYSNMSEVMAKSTSMLLTREPLDEIAKLNFVSKPPQYECRYPTCCKDSAGKEKKPPSFTTLSNCKQHIMRHREREEPGSVRPNPEYVKLDPPAPNTPPAVGGDAMDVDGVEVGGGASAGGPVAKDAKPLQTTLNVLVSKSGSDAMFGILNTAASFDVKPSDIPDKVAQFASRTNHHWNLSVLNRSNNNKSEAPAISAEEVKLNRPYRMSALEADKIFDFARFGEWTLNHLLSAKHGFTNLLADGENKRETDLFSAIHRNNIKSDFGNFKDKLLKAKDNKPVIEKLRSFHRSNYINGRRIFGLPPQQFHLTPVNNISVEFKGHDGFHELKSTKARDVCYTDSWAGGKKLRSKIEAQKVRVTLAVPLSKPRITIEMNVDGHQQPKNLETVVDQYLNLVRGENQDFDFASAQVMFCPETNQLRFHVPMKPNDSKRALPNPVEVKPLAKHTCSGNCPDCIKIRTDFKERTVKEGSFEPFRFEKHGEFVHPGLKGFNGMGMLRVKLSGNQWNASDKSAVGADIGHHTPYLMCDTALNFFEFGREGAQQLPYLLQCRSACQSLLDKGINTTAAVVEATRKAAEARLKRDNGKALPAEDRAKLETAVVKAAEDLAKERKTAKERIDKDAEDEQRKNQVAYDELRKAKFAQHYRARVGHNGREPPTHVHIGPFVPRSLSARIALYDKKIDAFAARLKDVVVRFTSVFDVVAFPDYKTNTAFKRLGFASIRDAVKREKDKRGGLFALINEAFTTCLCPLCGSDSNPGRSRYFICTDPACGFRCDRDSKSALLILLMLLLVPKTKSLASSPVDVFERQGSNRF